MGTSNANITLQGNPVVIVGNPLSVGASFPSFKLVGNDMKDYLSERIQGRPTVISVVPSLDTEVCSISTKRFNTEVTKLSKEILVLTVSRDLPFAQKRWCGAEGVDQVTTVSDYKYRSFGEATGTLWKDAELLARAVFVVDKAGVISYVDYVPEISLEPDYEGVIAAVKTCI